METAEQSWNVQTVGWATLEAHARNQRGFPRKTENSIIGADRYSILIFWNALAYSILRG